MFKWIYKIPTKPCKASQHRSYLFLSFLITFTFYTLIQLHFCSLTVAIAPVYAWSRHLHSKWGQCLIRLRCCIVPHDMPLCLAKW